MVAPAQNLGAMLLQQGCSALWCSLRIEQSSVTCPSGGAQQLAPWAQVLRGPPWGLRIDEAQQLFI